MSPLIHLESSLIQLESSLIQLENFLIAYGVLQSSLIQLKSSLIQLEIISNIDLTKINFKMTTMVGKTLSVEIR